MPTCCATKQDKEGKDYVACWECKQKMKAAREKAAAAKAAPKKARKTPVLINIPTPIRLTPKKTPKAAPKAMPKRKPKPTLKRRGIGDSAANILNNMAADYATLMGKTPVAVKRKPDLIVPKNAQKRKVVMPKPKPNVFAKAIAPMRGPTMRGPTRADKPISTAMRRPLRKPLDVYTGPAGGQYLKVNGKKQYVTVFRDGETSYILNNAYADKFGLPRGSRVPVNIVY